MMALPLSFRLFPKLSFLAVGLAFVGFAAAGHSQVPEHPWISSMHALRLDSLPGTQSVMYSNGHRERALFLRARLLEAIQFFKDSLGAIDPVRLAVVNAADWAAIFPNGTYTFASNRGPPPWVILQPATGKGALSEFMAAVRTRTSPEHWRQLDSTGIPDEALAVRHMDMVLIHELGHTLVRGGALPIRWAGNWFQEFLATYIMYSYLRALHPTWAAAYSAWDKLILDDAKDPYTAVTQYDQGIRVISVERRFWFFAALGTRVRECYNLKGLGLLRNLQKSLPRSGGWEMPDGELLPVLDAECPGFSRWANDMRY